MDLLNRYYQAYINALQNSQNQQPSPFNGMYGGGSSAITSTPIDENNTFISQPQQQYNIGRYGAGNIDLYNRPQIKNPDGSISTVRSMSFNDNGKEVLIPTVSQRGILSDREAIDEYYKTGKYLGKFNTPEEANAYANALHEQQANYYLIKPQRRNR